MAFMAGHAGGNERGGEAAFRQDAGKDETRQEESVSNGRDPGQKREEGIAQRQRMSENHGEKLLGPGPGRASPDRGMSLPTPRSFSYFPAPSASLYLLPSRGGALKGLSLGRLLASRACRCFTRRQAENDKRRSQQQGEPGLGPDRYVPREPEPVRQAHGKAVVRRAASRVRLAGGRDAEQPGPGGGYGPTERVRRCRSGALHLQMSIAFFKA